METNKAKIRDFLLSQFKTDELKDDDDIFDLGFVNSLFAMQMVMFVEGEFKIRFENEDLDLDNFRSVNAIAAIVEKKTA